MRRVTQFLGVAVLVVLASCPAAYADGMRGGAAVSRTGPHGTTVQGGARGGTYVGQGGRMVAGGAHGVKVTGPEGSTYVHGGLGGVATGPRGVAAAGARGTAVTGPAGTAAAGARGASWGGYARYYPAAPVWYTPYQAGWYVHGVR
jgi:hypothetical protein